MSAAYTLTPDAEQDLAEIAHYTACQWGKPQALRYAALLGQAFERIAEYPEAGTVVLSSPDEVRARRCEHHYVFYWNDPQDGRPVMLAVMHERMDVITRLKERLRSEDE